METKTDEIEKLSPERLMRMFSRSPIILAWILSVVIHLVVGAATSWEDTWALLHGKPTSWQKQGKEETNTTASATGTVASVTGTVSTVTGTVASADATGVVTVAAGTSLTGIATNELIPGSAAHEAEMLKKYSNAPVVQAITEVSTNVPSVADDPGLSIKDTEIFNK